MCFRKTPSSFAPIRSNALPERSFKTSVLNSTRMHPRVSKGCFSIRYFASVLAYVRCHSRPIHVHPISTRRFGLSMFANRVLPIALRETFSTVVKGSAEPSDCHRNAVSM